MGRPKRLRRLRHGFTLVEPLVVIGIVVLLIGLLIPVLAGARRQAQALGCAANLRVIGQAMIAYTLQERHYPGDSARALGPVNPPQTWGVMVWQTRLRRMMGGKTEANERVFHCPARPTEGFDFLSPGEAVGSRPRATAEHVGYGYVVGEPLIRWISGGLTELSYEPERMYSYGLNCFGTKPGRALGYETNDDGQHPEINNREPRVSRVKKPEAMIAVGDTHWVQGTQGIKYQPTIRPVDVAGPVGNVHRGGSNVLWCDGHVDWRRMEEITYTGEEDNTNAPKVSRVGPFWNASNSMR